MIKKSFGAVLQSTDTTIYEVPVNKRAEWVLIYATDTSGSSTKLYVDYYDASESATMEILNDYSMSANDFFKVGGEPNAFIMMEAGDKVIARAENNNDISFFVSVIETNALVTGG